MTTLAFVITGGVQLTVAEYLGGVTPPRNFVPLPSDIVQPLTVQTYPQLDPNNPDSKYSLWTYELNDGQPYTITLRARSSWIPDGILIVSDTIPYSNNSGVTVPPESLYNTIRFRQQAYSQLRDEFTGYNYLIRVVSAAETVLTTAIQVSPSGPKNYMIAAQNYGGNTNDLIGVEYWMPGDPVTTTTTTTIAGTTTTTTTTIPPSTTTTTTLPPFPLPARPFVNSVPIMFASTLASAIDIGLSANYASDLPIPIPEELSEEFEDLSFPQIEKIRLWSSSGTEVLDYGGRLAATINGNGVTTPKVTTNELYTNVVHTQVLTDGVVTIPLDVLLSLIARVEALEDLLG